MSKITDIGVQKMTDNIELFPRWKEGATAEERLSELSQVAAKYPHQFQKMALVYVEVFPNGNWKIRTMDSGLQDKFQTMGVLFTAIRDIEESMRK